MACLSVYLSVNKITQKVIDWFSWDGGWIRIGRGTNWLDFGTDLDLDLDLGSISPLLQHGEIRRQGTTFWDISGLIQDQFFHFSIGAWLGYFQDEVLNFNFLSFGRGMHSNECPSSYFSKPLLVNWMCESRLCWSCVLELLVTQVSMLSADNSDVVMASKQQLQKRRAVFGDITNVSLTVIFQHFA